MNYNKGIPYSSKPLVKSIVFEEKPKLGNIVFSFEFLDFNEYFNIDCTCPKWSFDLVTMMKDVSSVSQKRFKTDSQFRSGKFDIHYHGNVKPPIPFPHGIEMDTVEQIRLGKSKGGIHGVLVENIFYVIWLDPLHNLYPDSRYGGLKKIKPPITCCGWRDEELDRLSKENSEYRELFEST
jgi:hypothetical protein